MKHTVHHDLNDDEAKTAVLRALARYRDRYAEYSPSMLWSDDRSADLGFSFKGYKVTGRLELRPSAVDLDVDVPLALRMFKRMAIAAIDEEVRRYLGEAHRERALRAPAAVVEEAV
ncbi:polyhydroxyalkanoic acid system family protein (plasmid) [Sorangium sp. So ce119]|uniref:polyhydroxyalkanoic acid system family protein n=1 Tax=Sorangium sp. So ce119 TaxID=3133279 RepID=UPI003F631203